LKIFYVSGLNRFSEGGSCIDKRWRQNRIYQLSPFLHHIEISKILHDVVLSGVFEYDAIFTMPRNFLTLEFDFLILRYAFCHACVKW